MNEHSNSLLSQILAEQVRQTELLQSQTSLLKLMADQQLILIQELAASEQCDPDAEPNTYMDGTLIIGRS